MLLIGGSASYVSYAGTSDQPVTINMRDADIRALIQWIAEQTHKQIVIDPRVQGRVSIFADQPVTITQAYPGLCHLGGRRCIEDLSDSSGQRRTA